MKQQWLSAPKDPMLEMQMSALNAMVKQMDPKFSRMKNKLVEKDPINMFPLSLKGSTLELGKQNDKKHSSEKKVFG